MVLFSGQDDWRTVLESVDGYPAGNMLEIALRRTKENKLEMFKWRSEFIAIGYFGLSHVRRSHVSDCPGRLCRFGLGGQW